MQSGRLSEEGKPGRGSDPLTRRKQTFWAVASSQMNPPAADGMSQKKAAIGTNTTFRKNREKKSAGITGIWRIFCLNNKKFLLQQAEHNVGSRQSGLDIILRGRHEVAAGFGSSAVGAIYLVYGQISRGRACAAGSPRETVLVHCIHMYRAFGDAELFCRLGRDGQVQRKKGRPGWGAPFS